MNFDKTKIRKFLRESSLPLILLVLYFFVFYFQNFFSVPSQDDFLKFILEFVNNQNLFFLFLIAFIEGILVFGQYAPGSIIIFLSIISSGGDPIRIFLLVIVVSTAFFIAYLADYFIGHYGLETLFERIGLSKYTEKPKRLLKKNLLHAIFFSYFDPSFASVTSTVAGITRVPLKKFITFAIPSIIFWNVLWTILLIFVGNTILNILAGINLLLLIILAWILFLFYKNFIKKEEIPESANL